MTINAFNRNIYHKKATKLIEKFPKYFLKINYFDT